MLKKQGKRHASIIEQEIHAGAHFRPVAEHLGRPAVRGKADSDVVALTLE
jgi:hypothetical protein